MTLGVKHEAGGVKVVVRGPALIVRVLSNLVALDFDQYAVSKESEYANSDDRVRRWGIMVNWDPDSEVDIVVLSVLTGFSAWDRDISTVTCHNSNRCE